MDITYVYTKLRSNFGRPLNLTDGGGGLMCHIASDNDTALQFVDKTPLDTASQSCVDRSEHEVNTETVQTVVKGVDHVEGGWPRDVNHKDPDQVARNRKKIEKDEGYQECVKRLMEAMEPCIDQNNSLDIYELYFEQPFPLSPPPHFTITNQYCDFYNLQRPVSHISWYTDGPRKFATSHYDSLRHNELYTSPQTHLTLHPDCYVWDVETSYEPELTLKPESPVMCLEYNPKDPNSLVAGLTNGQLVLWDTKASSKPVEMTDALKGHKEKVKCVSWLQSKTGSDLFSAALDGEVLWWDVRKMSEPLESIQLDWSRKQDPNFSLPAECLEYEPTIPTRFMAGCREGMVLLCNRKAKSPVEKVSVVYQSPFQSPVYSVQRNPFFLKAFLTTNAHQIMFWSEDWKETAIWSSKVHDALVLQGCWSPVRPSILFSSTSAGSVSCWNVLINQKRPVCELKLSDQPLRVLKVQEQGGWLLVGGDDGKTSLLKLSEDLSVADKNEKKDVAEFFDRETKRERNLEITKRDKKKNRDKVVKEESMLSKCLLEDESEEGFYDRLHNQFFLEYEEEKKKVNRKLTEWMDDD